MQKIYYSPSEYGWWWFFLQVPCVFIYQDYITYVNHRVYHIPFLYKNFHKLHHKYKQPTAFSVTAIHPVEIVHMQLSLVLPIFVVPLHWVMFYAVGLYTYYHAILDHSGITFKAHWWQPWQPDAIFHDNHHQYTHVNFGFNIELWDHVSVAQTFLRIAINSFLFQIYINSCTERIVARIECMVKIFSMVKDWHWTRCPRMCYGTILPKEIQRIRWRTKEMLM